MKRFSIIFILMLILIPSIANAELTGEQEKDISYFIPEFISTVNNCRDEKGYPLFAYALGPTRQNSKDIRTNGYNEKLSYINNSYYHIYKNEFVNLGYKWSMDCATYVAYMYKTMFGLELKINGSEEPWHARDFYNNAKKGNYFYLVYENTKIQNLKDLQPGDVIIWLGKEENHSMIYIGEGQIAHAINSAIRYYQKPVVLGLETIALRKYYLDNTRLNVLRIKDGIIDKNQEIGMTYTWPNTGEKENLRPEEETLKEKLLQKTITYVDQLKNHLKELP